MKKRMWTFGIIIWVLLVSAQGFAGAVGDMNADNIYDLRDVIMKMHVLSGLQLETFTNCLGMTFKRIPAGTFTMGSPDTEPGRFSDETQHPVTLTKDFFIMTTEVTQKQWRDVMGNNPSSFISCGDNCPVENVSWNDTDRFIARMNRRGEGTYRLPTEAEWEYAVRAGSTTAFYIGGVTNLYCNPTDPNLNLIGWYCGNSAQKNHPVAQKQPNAWGLYDMSGNVYEWCQDWYGTYPISATDPTGPTSGSNRVFRGGSWDYLAVGCRSAYRNKATPDYWDITLGFRLVRSAP
jgi:formylglycine-generating enzyme required for sulfatase activity